jgi:hypothetical protein
MIGHFVLAGFDHSNILGDVTSCYLHVKKSIRKCVVAYFFLFIPLFIYYNISLKMQRDHSTKKKPTKNLGHITTYIKGKFQVPSAQERVSAIGLEYL